MTYRDLRSLLVLLMPMLVVTLCANAVAEAPFRALILSGQSNHDWMQTTPVIQQILIQTGRFRADVTQRPDQLTSNTLASYDVVISNWNTFGKRADIQEWPEETRQAYIGFVMQGKGHVVIHAGSSSFPNWQEYQQLCLATWGSLHRGDVYIVGAGDRSTLCVEQRGFKDGLFTGGYVCLKDASRIPSCHRLGHLSDAFDVQPDVCDR
jgi:hypothetical protein